MSDLDNKEEIIRTANGGELKSSRTTKRGIALAALSLAVIMAIGATSFFDHNVTPKDKIIKIVETKTATVKINDNGFSPVTLTIKKDTVVFWVGSQLVAKPVIVASNPYPNDDSLPGLKSGQISAGATYKYKFDKVGSYSYHDDLNPNVNGFVVVE